MSKTFYFQHEDYPGLDLEIILTPGPFRAGIEIRQTNKLLVNKPMYSTHIIEENNNRYRVGVINSPMGTNVIINGKKHCLASVTKKQFLFTALPTLLVFMGVIGSFIGVYAWSVNMNYLRFSNFSSFQKALIIALVTLLAYSPLIVIIMGIDNNLFD